MGLLIDGTWHDRWYDTDDGGGRFVRKDAQFRNWVTPDGAPGPSGEGGFAAEPGRYHLYVSLACPWAHRTLIFRALKGLEDVICVSVVALADARARLDLRPGPGVTGDRLNGARYLHEIYTRARSRLYRPGDRAGAVGQASGRRSSTTNSSEIIRMLNSAFDGFGAAPGDSIRRPCAPRSTGSTRASTTRSTTASTGPASPPPRPPTRRPSTELFASARLARGAAGAPPLSGRRPAHRGRLAAVHHAGALRPGLSRPLQVQPAPARRLSEPVGLPARPLPAARRGRDRRLRPHQAALLRQPCAPSTRPASCPWARSWISRHPMAGRCWRPRPDAAARLALLLLLGACEPESDRPMLASYRPGAAVEPHRWSAPGAAATSTLIPISRARRSPPPTPPTARTRARPCVPKRGPLGPIQVTQRGRWSIDDARLVTSDVVTDAHAVDGNTSTEALAKASAEVVDAMSAGKPAASEVLRLDARRLTLRAGRRRRPAGHRLPAVSGRPALATAPGAT